MEQAPQLMVLFGSLISLLLSVVAYFIKQLHTDFKRMEKDLVEVKTMALLIKTEFKSSSDLLNQKVDYLGVAFADEGIALKSNGIHLPIMVLKSCLVRRIQRSS